MQSIPDRSGRKSEKRPVPAPRAFFEMVALGDIVWIVDVGDLPGSQRLEGHQEGEDAWGPARPGPRARPRRGWLAATRSSAKLISCMVN